MQTSQEVTNIFKAICECKKDFVPLQKNKQGYGYKYVTLDSVIDMLNTVLPKHGLGFVQFPSMNGDNYSLTTRVIHESGEWMEDTITFSLTEISKANDTQKLGASVTYFRRYTLSSIFGIASDEDIDGNIETAVDVQNNQKKQFNETSKPQYQQQYQKKQSNSITESVKEPVRKENEFLKEKYSNLYLTIDENCNNILKSLADEKYKDELVLSDKTKSFINDKVDQKSFNTKEDYVEYVKRASLLNKKKIESKITEQQTTSSNQSNNQSESIEF